MHDQQESSQVNIQYVVGDATRPVGKGPKVICHICNDQGGWGKGFVVALSDRWLSPEQNYRAWYKGSQPRRPPFELGQIQFVPVEEDLYVVNMIAQTLGYDNGPPIRYDALEKCLAELARVAENKDFSVHMPKIGTGLAGGTWDKVEPIIQRTLIANDVPVTVYDLPSTDVFTTDLQ